MKQKNENKNPPRGSRRFSPAPCRPYSAARPPCSSPHNPLCMFAFTFLLILTLSPLLYATATDAFSWSDPNALMGRAAGYYTHGTGAWYQMTILAIAICIFANTIVYVFGRVAHAPHVMQFAKAEFFQVTASAVMIFVLVAGGAEAFNYIKTSGIMPAGTTTLCYGTAMDVWGTGPFGIIRCHLQEKIEYTESLYNQAWLLNKDTEPLTTYSLYLFNIPVYVWDWNTELHSQMESAHYIANKLTPIGISLHAQFMFAEYLAQNMLTVFLPLGLLLRIFPILRGLGSLMVAMAIGFFFVFPIAYILMDPTTVRPDPTTLIPAVDNTKANVCYTSFSGMVSTYTQVAPKAASDASTLDLGQVGAEMAKLQIEAFFYPLAALACALLFITIATPILGGDSGEIMHFMSKVI